MDRFELPDEAIVFDSPDFDDAIIGETIESQAVYDYWKLAEILTSRDGYEAEQAIDYIENNLVGMLPYMGEYAPIIVMLCE